MPPFIPLEKILRAQALKASGLSWSQVGLQVQERKGSIQGAVRRYERGLHNGLREQQAGPEEVRLMPIRKAAELRAWETSMPLEDRPPRPPERVRERQAGRMNLDRSGIEMARAAAEAQARETASVSLEDHLKRLTDGRYKVERREERERRRQEREQREAEERAAKAEREWEAARPRKLISPIYKVA